MSSESVNSWAELVSRGTDNAIAGLAEMVGQEIEVTAFRLRSVPVAEIPHIVGGPEVLSVGIYLSVSGTASGHLMLLYEPRIAHAFVDLVMGQPLGTTEELGAMEQSALGEIGNVVGAFFLSAIADATELDLRPSPPSVMTDMAGALLDVVTSEILMTRDDTFLVETAYRVAGQEVSGVFFVIPSEELLEFLLTARQAA